MFSLLKKKEGKSPELLKSFRSSDLPSRRCLCDPSPTSSGSKTVVWTRQILGHVAETCVSVQWRCGERINDL